MKTLGIVLVALGITMSVITGFTLITKKEIVDLGPLEINREEKTPVYWSPLTGGVLVVAGLVVMLVAVSKKK